MAGRGWGRGRGRGGGRGEPRYAPPVPFVLFPEDINLPEAKVKLGEIDVSTKRLLRWSYSFDTYFKAAPYVVEETELKGRKRMDIERYSDKKKTMFARDSLSQVLSFDGFVKELVPGASKKMPSRKKFRWNPEADAKKLQFFEELEKKFLGREDKDKENKEDESEDEDEEDNEPDEGDFRDGDYNQNEYFDDDEDDYNDVEEGAGEDVF